MYIINVLYGDVNDFLCVQEQHSCRLRLIVSEQVFVAETNTAAAARVIISIIAVHMCGDKLSGKSLQTAAEAD